MSQRSPGTASRATATALGVALACVSFGTLATSAQDLVISEFMAASSRAVLVDQDGDSPDWLEVYNASGASVVLSGWSLTDDANDLRKWPLPNRELKSHGFLLVFASG